MEKIIRTMPSEMLRKETVNKICKTFLKNTKIQMFKFSSSERTSLRIINPAVYTIQNTIKLSNLQDEEKQFLFSLFDQLPGLAVAYADDTIGLNRRVTHRAIKAAVRQYMETFLKGEPTKHSMYIDTDFVLSGDYRFILFEREIMRVSA